MNLISIALKSQDIFKEKDGDKYGNSLFIGVAFDDSIKISYDASSVLGEVKRCFILHSYYRTSVSQYDYVHYHFVSIDETGEKNYAILDDDFTIVLEGGNSDSLKLKLNKETIMSITLYDGVIAEETFRKIWNTYVRIRTCVNIGEARLIAKLAQQDESILQLEKEIEGFKYENHILEKEKALYKGILDEIKELVKKSTSD